MQHSFNQTEVKMSWGKCLRPSRSRIQLLGSQQNVRLSDSEPQLV